MGTAAFGSGISASQALVAAAVFLAAAATTALVRSVAVRLRWLAEPNSRSSHQAPTPTGGGLGFVVPVLALLALWSPEPLPAAVLAASGTVVAAVGLIDDLHELRRDLRLAVHLMAAAACVVFLADEGVLLAGVLVVGFAWWINLYNFMDGIDGIAASQTVLFAACALLIGDLDASARLAWTLLAATAAFLCFNWAPAKIFMGDIGSGFLGVATGALALMLWQNDELPFVASLILLVGFWFDASYTLGVRIVTGQPFTDAHRLHLYQILSRRLGHGRTTALFCAHAVAWLAPLAAVSVAFPAWQFACLAAACLPAAIACASFKAGVAHAR